MGEPIYLGRGCRRFQGESFGKLGFGFFAGFPHGLEAKAHYLLPVGNKGRTELEFSLGLAAFGYVSTGIGIRI